MERIVHQPTYLDRPIEMGPFGHYTGDILTLGVALRGPQPLNDFYDDPEYVVQLFDFLTEATIARIQAHHHFFNLPTRAPDLFLPMMPPRWYLGKY